MCVPQGVYHRCVYLRVCKLGIPLGCVTLGIPLGCVPLRCVPLMCVPLRCVSLLLFPFHCWLVLSLPAYSRFTVGLLIPALITRFTVGEREKPLRKGRETRHREGFCTRSAFLTSRVNSRFTVGLIWETDGKSLGMRHREQCCTRRTVLTSGYYSRFTVGGCVHCHHPFHCWCSFSRSLAACSSLLGYSRNPGTYERCQNINSRKC